VSVTCWVLVTCSVLVTLCVGDLLGVCDLLGVGDLLGMGDLLGVGDILILVVCWFCYYCLLIISNFAYKSLIADNCWLAKVCSQV
jgi:hypothetical protein